MNKMDELKESALKDLEAGCDAVIAILEEVKQNIEAEKNKAQKEKEEPEKKSESLWKDYNDPFGICSTKLYLVRFKGSYCYQKTGIAKWCPSDSTFILTDDHWPIRVSQYMEIPD